MITTSNRDEFVWLAVGLALLAAPAYLLGLVRWRLASLVATASSVPVLLLFFTRPKRAPG